MTGFAQHERGALCDALAACGPDAPTLCEGWTASDLAAHLVVRERRPVAALGIVVKPLAPRTAHVQNKLRDRMDYTDLVGMVRDGPPLLLRPFDEPMNTAEYFVHTEDVRRAAPDSSGDPVPPRPLEAGLETALWKRARMMARSVGKKVGGKVVLVAPGYGQVVSGEGGEATVTGDPGEILLLLFGRGRVARLAYGGDPDVVAALQRAELGI